MPLELIRRLGVVRTYLTNPVGSALDAGVSTAAPALSKMLNVINMAKYMLTLPTLTDGDGHPLVLDINALLRTREGYRPAYELDEGAAATITKAVAVGTFAATLFKLYAGAATLNCKATPGNLLTILSARNRNAAARFLQFHDTATVPAGGATALISFEIPGSSSLPWPIVFPTTGLWFPTGIAVAWSTTNGTYTAATGSEHDVNAMTM